ncbi:MULTISPECIES: DNA-formamidopyrimidine glycosylase family protein [unclassified Microbacterium]|uniref:DNA-formamidopyrimidine glycosylase family protein n=1 Tax=unclassified Microbacterium TaxID=2609290 RepID=UPI00214BFB37|nr:MULTISPECIES: DNA-formamidopyrimidine glycosylase family protein [unclassified Microbacterium]MCR2808763.1 Fpg/Nei family DNA glycosylase [Microbacterium sp. zg.B185]WIM18810.1 DNA-formamidopyrimidine glycosylase family protein [Microbacterium sp. zg-B185]
MPEGDTVHRAAQRLHDALAGNDVTRFDLRVPQLATADLRGMPVHAVVARGKHLLHRIGEWTLHSHLKMEGEWRVYRPGEPWRKPAFQARAIVGTQQWDTVGFDLAEIDLVPTDAEGSLVDYLGPDPLGPDWDAAEATRRLAADTRAVHVAVLDQRNVAGFGNVYANEMLFLRGILPTTPATEVDAAALLDLGTRMIRANVHRAARTFTGEDRPGRRFWVYSRAGKPCRRCGAVIREASLGARPTSERNVFWCPRCQI